MWRVLLLALLALLPLKAALAISAVTFTSLTTATGVTIIEHPANVVSLHISDAGDGSSNTVILKDGGANVARQLTLFGVTSSVNDILLPGDGFDFRTNVFIDVDGPGKVTIIYR